MMFAKSAELRLKTTLSDKTASKDEYELFIDHVREIGFLPMHQRGLDALNELQEYIRKRLLKYTNELVDLKEGESPTGQATFSRASPEQKLFEILVAAGKSRVKMPSDGSCFFHSMNHQGKIQHIKVGSAKHIRFKAVDHVLHNWDTNKDSYPEITGLSIDKIRKTLRSSKYWADHPLIQATAEVLRVEITVWRSDGTQTVICPLQNNATWKAEISYIVELHYDSVISKEPWHQDSLASLKKCLRW